jgi:thiamine-phosphate pyrophosphorylase
MSLVLPRLYPITDTIISCLSHAEQVERLAAGGATLIQLREKLATPREFYEAARRAVSVARTLGVQIVINDRADIAIAVKADGVHLGQTDLPPARARSLLGPSRILGYSTHTLEQALEATMAPVDYIAVGPVFGTRTKQNPDAMVGLEMIKLVRAQVSRPLVAIGGITLDSARAVLDAGADSVAVIWDLLSTADIAERTRSFIYELEVTDGESIAGPRS